MSDVQRPPLYRGLHVYIWYDALKEMIKRDLRVYEINTIGEYRYTVERVGDVFYRRIDEFNQSTKQYDMIIYSPL